MKINFVFFFAKNTIFLYSFNHQAADNMKAAMDSESLMTSGAASNMVAGLFIS